MTDLEMTRIIRDALNDSLVGPYRCSVALSWTNADWAPDRGGPFILVYEDTDVIPSARVWYDKKGGIVHFDLIKLANLNELCDRVVPCHKVDIADPDAFTSITRLIEHELV